MKRIFNTLPDYFTKRRNLVFVLVLFVVQVQSQVFYSTDRQYFLSKPEGDNILSAYKVNYPDTTLDNFHQQFPINFSGNLGLPSPNYFMKYGTDKIGFRFYDLPYNDFLKEKNILYVQSKGPYASINGITGSKQLQSGKIVYAQTFANGLSLSFDFKRFTSQGYYLRQQTYTNNFTFNTHYQSFNKRWGFYTFLLNNANKSQENGGIKDRVLSDSTVFINKQLMAVNLKSASRDNRQTKVMFNPWLRLNRANDSTLPKTNHYLQLKSQVDFNALKYKDLNLKNDKFYQAFYNDSSITNDSSNFRQFNNSLIYTFKQSSQKVGASLAYQNEINQVWQRNDSVFMNHKVFASSVIRNFNPSDTLISKGWESTFNFEYIFAGKNNGNYKIENNSIFYLNILKGQSLYFNFLTEKRNADYIYNTWRSNHFIWNNQFAAQEQAQAQVGFNWGKDFQISCLYQNIFKYLYFDEEAKPAQLKQSIDNFAANINYAHVFFKHLGMAFAHTYQSTSKAKYYRVPENISSVKLFYNGSLFKNNLNLQIGSQLTIFQSFKALAYMPSTQAFYLQSQATTAALPFVDVYLNARIHPVSIFLKVENVLQGVVGNNYSFVPGYYQTDRAFRCGLVWMFFD